MLNSIIHFSIRNKLITGLFVLALIAYGSYQVTQLPIDAVPDITNNQVQVITNAPSLGTVDIERFVTIPLEQEARSIPGLKEIRSMSRFGFSLITMVFDDGVDIYWARQQINEKIQAIKGDLPPEITPPFMAPVTTGLGEIYQYVVKPAKGYESKYTLTELRTIQDWQVRRQLLGTKGVADVSTFGGELKQLEVAINPDKLKGFGITISEVFLALKANNQNTGGAYIEKGPTVAFIRSEGLVGSISDIENIVVKTTSSNVPILIRDLAEVKIGAATRYGAVTYNAEGEVVGAIVMMLKGENSSDVIKRVKQRIEEIRKTLPEGVVIEPFLDRTKMVNNAIGTVETNLMEGAIIVLFILVLFLGNWRAGFIVASVIPLAMLFAIIMMNLFGVSGNLMSLGALDFGLIVDGAVIIVEAVLHHLHQSKKGFAGKKLNQGEMDDVVFSSSSRMMNAAVFGQIIILIVYLPILSLEGIEGKMFKPMAQTIAFAILGAFILSLTYIPMMTALFTSKDTEHKLNFSDKVMLRLEAWYGRAREAAMAYSKTVVSFVVVCFAVAVVLLMNMGGEFIPELEEGDFAVETRLLVGTNLSTTIAMTQKASAILLKNFPEVERVVNKIGSGEIPTDPMPIEASDMMVILKDKKEWTSAKTFDELSEKMSLKLADLPGFKAGFQFPVQMRFNELMTGAKQDVVCKIFGENLDTLAFYAEKIGQLAQKTEGAKDLYVEAINGVPQIIVRFNREAIAKYGLNISEMNMVVNAAFAGSSAGKVYEGEKRFDLVVRLSSESRKDINDVINLLVQAPSGIQIPLNQVAEITEVEGPNQVQREDARRRVVLGFNVRGKDVETVVNDLRAKVESQIKFPPDYHITYGGTFENLQAAKQRLSFAIPVALLLIFLMLYFAFGSISDGLLIFSAIPLSAIGGVFSLYMRGMPFSISAGVGFIALFGVAVLNGLVLISEFNRLKKEGLRDILEVVKRGTTARLRPVLMTAAVASLGFMPMALSNGAGAEVQRPLATVVIGGLVTATFLTLLVLPVLYVWKEKKPRKPKAPTVPIAAVLLLISFSGFSQTTPKRIPLKKALEMAEANNKTLKSAKLDEETMAKIKSAWLNIPKTNANFAYGHVNSAYIDNLFSVSQNIAFPSVYSNQKKQFNEDFLASQSATQLALIQVKAEVKSLHYQVLVLEEKQKLLTYADSIYGVFEQRANLKFRAGESNLMEKVTAENQRHQIKNQLRALDSDLGIALLQFNFWIGSGDTLKPERGDDKYFLFRETDSLVPEKHPRLEWQLHQVNLGKYKWKGEKAKALPDITLGYSNMSIIGWQRIDNADQYFGAGKRFGTVNAGLSVPVFFRAHSSHSQAAKVQYLKAQNDLELEKEKLSTELKVALSEVDKCEALLLYYAGEGMKNARTISKTSQLQFQNGEIDFLQFVMLINQSFAIENDYLMAKLNLNQAKIKLELLTEKF